MNNIHFRLNRLELIALVCGFVLMVFELAGARILAPGIGSSTYVWTSVIGIIIAALSLGYWIGGMLADRRGYMIDIARLALLTSLMVSLTMTYYGVVINWVAESFDDSRLQGVMASLVLFAPTSFFIGTISPYLAKLKVQSLSKTGQSIASLSALNSIGGILGTFIAGFVLFGYIGSYETLGITAGIMVAASWLAAPKIQWKPRALMSVTIAIVIILSTPATATTISIDTPSARYMINDWANRRLLATGPQGAQSGVSLVEKNSLIFWYTQQLAELVAYAPARQNILILGGGALTLPQYLANKYPKASIDVVEIDPDLAGIARKYFYYKDPSNVELVFQDARTYVNQTNKKYDIILVDVYSDIYIPFTLLTKEYGDNINRLLEPRGIVAANLIAGLGGECRTLFAALSAPYLKNLQYAAYTIEIPQNKRSNIVAAYSRIPLNWPSSRTIPRGTTLYTDNFAPVERLQYGCRQA